MENFFSFPETGKLQVERVFLDAGYPILFTCINEQTELFLCVCCQSNIHGKKWLLVQTEPKMIINMLEDKITIRDAFIHSGDRKFTIFQNEQLSIQSNVEEDWDAVNSIALPDAGEYMEAEEDEFAEDISHYRSLIRLEMYAKILTKALANTAWSVNVKTSQYESFETEYDTNLLNKNVSCLMGKHTEIYDNSLQWYAA